MTSTSIRCSACGQWTETGWPSENEVWITCEACGLRETITPSEWYERTRRTPEQRRAFVEHLRRHL